MKTNQLFTLLALSSLALSSSTFGADSLELSGTSKRVPTSTITDSTPLKVRSLTGYTMEIESFQEGDKILDLKNQVAQKWNAYYNTNLTGSNIILVGLDFLVGNSTGATIAYKNDSSLSTNPKTFNAVKLLSVVIKP